MRRAVALVFGTVTGAALLVGAKIGNASGVDPSAADATASGGVVTSGDDPTGSPSPHAHPSAGTPTGRPPASAKPTTAKTGTSKSPSPTKTTAKPTPSGLKSGTYNASADVEGGRRGKLSMTVTISGGKITDIKASESNPSEPSCWQNACPTLRGEALSAQSSSIDTVSRATYTSQAYKSSLQAVLNAAKG